MEPYVGQIMQVGFNFAPKDWATCSGQIMSIAQNSALFSLLGTTFGGNGQTTFGLPDARGRAFLGTGQGPGLQPYVLGQIGGTEHVTLTSLQMPAHTHGATFTPSGSVSAHVQAKTAVPQGELSDTPTEGCFLANTTDPEVSGTPLIYAPATSTATAVNLGGVGISGASGGSVSVTPVGGSMPVSITQPFIGITTVIALQGVYPPRD